MGAKVRGRAWLRQAEGSSYLPTPPTEEEALNRRIAPAWLTALAASLAGGPAAGQVPAPLTRLHLFPTADVPSPWQASVELGQTTTFRGATSDGGGGSGNQTYHGWITLGLPGRIAAFGFIQGNDDPTWGRLNRVRYRQETFAVGGGLRAELGAWRGVTVAAEASLARLDLKSDPGLFTPDPGGRRSFHSSAAASVMAGFPLGSRWRVTLAPSVVYLPSTVNGLPYYGWTGMAGAGVDGRLSPRWRVFASGELPLGPGGNSVAGDFDFRRVPVGSAGVVYEAGPRTRVTAFLTNAAGGSPGTRHLTHLGEVPLQWGARVRFSPTAPDPVRTHRPSPGEPGVAPGDGGGVPREEGVGVPSAATLPAWQAEIRATLDAAGSRSTRLRVGLSREAEVELGVVRIPGLDAGPGLGIRLGKDLHYRLGGKLAFLAEAWGHPVTAAARVTVGRDLGTGQGYLVAEIPVRRRLGRMASLTVAPAILQTGGRSPLAMGAAAVLGEPGRVHAILEPLLVSGGRSSWTVALRSPAYRGARGELFATTASGTLGVGRFMAVPGAPRFGAGISLGIR